MKKLYTILNAAFWCFIGVFLGVSLYTCWDYRAHPGLYALQSAPWYLSIQIHAVFTIVVCGILALGIWMSSGRRGGSKILPYKSTDKRVSAVSMRAGHARPLQA